MWFLTAMVLIGSSPADVELGVYPTYEACEEAKRELSIRLKRDGVKLLKSLECSNKI